MHDGRIPRLLCLTVQVPRAKRERIAREIERNMPIFLLFGSGDLAETAVMLVDTLRAPGPLSAAGLACLLAQLDAGLSRRAHQLDDDEALVSADTLAAASDAAWRRAEQIGIVTKGRF